MKKRPLSDEEQLDELLVELQKKFLSGDFQPASDRKKTKEEIDDEKFQAQLAAMLGNLSASSAKIKKAKKKAAPPVEIAPVEEEIPALEEASTPDEPPTEEIAPAPITSTEKKPRKRSSHPKKPPVEESTIEEPIVEEPIVEEPIVEEPIVEEPIIEEPINSIPIVIKPRVYVESSDEPVKSTQDAIRITSPITPKSEPIRIVPRQRVETKPQPSRHADAIVIRPKAYPTPKSEPIVIRPRAAESTRPIPQKQSPAPSAQPIKIGKEAPNDTDV